MEKVFRTNVIVMQIALCIEDISDYKNFLLTNKFICSVCLLDSVKKQKMDSFTKFNPFCSIDGKFCGDILKLGQKHDTHGKILYGFDEENFGMIDVIYCEDNDVFNFCMQGGKYRVIQKLKIPDSTYKRYKRRIDSICK